MGSQPYLTRRSFIRLSAIGLSAALAACAPQVTPEPTVAPEPPKEAPTAAQSVAEATQVPEAPAAAAGTPEEILTAEGNMPGSPDHPRGWRTLLPDLPPAVPYTPPVVITNARRVDAGTKFVGSDDLANNPWTRMVKSLFGIEYKTLFTWVTADEGNQKYNLAMASGELPDYMEEMPNAIFLQAVQADMLEDITEAFDLYACPRWKKATEDFAEMAWALPMVNGRKYGYCRALSTSAQDSITWYRVDWLEQVGLDVPKTLDDCYNVAKAFIEADLGQGDKGTTIGISANDSYKARNGAWSSTLDVVFGAWRIAPEHWTPEGDGLMYNAIRPIVKEPLAVLRKWYADGILRKDFYTLQISDSQMDYSSNQCGLHFSPTYSLLRDSVQNDPTARWGWTDIPTGPTGQKGKNGKSPYRDNPFCYRKGATTIEQNFQVINWMSDLVEEPERRMHGWEGHDYEWNGDEFKVGQVSWSKWTIGPVGAAGGSRLDPRYQGIDLEYKMNEWGKIPPEKRDAQQELFFADPTGVETLNREAQLFVIEHNAEDALQDSFQALPTPTMISHWADLKKLEDETYISIITGQKPLEAFDAFVEQWKQMGGDQVTAEVTEWYKNK